MNKQELIALVNNPESLARDDQGVLREGLEKFPYCATLHMLLAKSLHKNDSIHYEEQLKLAAVYAGDRTRLYELINGKISLNEQTELIPEKIKSPIIEIEEQPIVEPTSTVPKEELTETEVPVEVNEVIEEKKIEEIIKQAPAVNDKPEIVLEVKEPEFSSSLLSGSFFNEGDNADEDIEMFAHDYLVEKNSIEQISSEVIQQESIPEPVVEIENKEEIISEQVIEEQEPLNEITFEAESIEEQKETELIQEEQKPALFKLEEPERISEVEVLDNTELESRANEFHTFSQWLQMKGAKRREENDSSAPLFIKLDTEESIKSVPKDELEKLYLESIYHIEYEGNLDSTIKKPLDKEDLLDRFIRNSPKIAHADEVNIVPENKAKESSNDEDLVVSETLAGIYLKQKHYDKAIRAYEKLSLKFPEKSLYFAGLIEKIKSEHSIN